MISTTHREAVHLMMKSVFLINKVAGHLIQKNRKITLSQFKILTALKMHSGIIQKHIASFLGITEAAVSRQIDILESKKMVKKNKGKIVVTKNGAEEVASIFNSLLDPFLAKSLKGASNRTIDQHIDLNKLIIQNIIKNFQPILGNCCVDNK